MTTDKDKLKQILVNLVTNACDSVVEHDQARNILFLRKKSTGPFRSRSPILESESAKRI